MNSRPALLLARVTLVSAVSGLSLAALTGCGVNLAGGNSVAAAMAGSGAQPTTMGGILHGGPNPIQNASVRLYASASNGYGGAATLLSTTSTDQYGFFSFTLGSNFSCPSGQFAYVTAYGGNSGANTANANAMLMTPIGSCDTNYTGNVYTGPTLWADELTTAVSAYTLGNFITIDNSGGNAIVNLSAPAANNAKTPCVATSSNTATCPATAAAGLPHAMANALSMLNINTGQPNATNNHNGLVPVMEINLLGNILQACINSTGISGTNTATANDGTLCGKLFSLTTPPTPSAATPTDTLQAMINLAHYPVPQVNTWSSDCTAAGSGTATATSCIFGLATSIGAYTNALSAAPPDWSMSISYPKGLGVVTTGCATTCPGLTYPWMVALDISDNIFVTNNDSSSQTYDNVIGFAFDGTPLWATAEDTVQKVVKFIATDGLGHVMIANNSGSPNNVIKVYDGATGTLQTTVAGAVSSPFGLTADPFNNIWYSSSTASVQNIQKLTYGGNDPNGNPTYAAATLSPAPTASQGIYQIEIDSNLNLWGVGNATTSSAFFYPNTNTTATALTAPTYTGTLKSAATSGSTTNGYGIAPDSNGNAWEINGTGLYKITKSGSGNTATISSGSTIASGTTAPRYVAIDGANTVFSADDGSSANGVVVYDTADAMSLGEYKSCRVNTTNKNCGAGNTSTSSPSAVSGGRGLAIDSSGNVWVTSSNTGAITEILSVAAPTWPALSLAKAGRPQ